VNEWLPNQQRGSGDDPPNTSARGGKGALIEQVWVRALVTRSRRSQKASKFVCHRNRVIRIPLERSLTIR
jgi:hypothetical protein